ncbi:zinc ribbon domain-containing protein, partial [bacterium]
LDTTEAEIKKYQIELNAVKTNEAYTALISQITDRNTKKDDMENQIIGKLEEIEKQTNIVARIEEVLAKYQSEINTKKAELEAEKKQLEDNVNELDSQKNKMCKVLSKKIFTLYEKIRESKKGVAIAEVIEGCCCSGCHMALTAQVIDDLIKDSDLILCNNCNRILYITDANVEEIKNPDLKK